MHISFCRTSISAVLLGLAFIAAPSTSQAQDEKPVSALDRVVGRIDLSVSAMGEFTGDDNGTNYLGQKVALVPSTTVGYAISGRYIRKPLFGLEFNYNYARYNNNFTLSASPTQPLLDPAIVYGVQANTKEYSFGYVAHTRSQYFGVTPFVAAGIGTLKFTPTVNGGEGFKQQYRALYYGAIGVERYITGDHVGVRAQFRENYHNAPDFLTNYITIHQHTFTAEPMVGLFLRF